MQSSPVERMQRSPIIVAVRDPKDLPAALASSQPTVFLLSADIGNVVELVYSVRSKGKDVFVHFDLISGLGRDHQALKWLSEMAEPTGIITTRAPLIAHAKGLGLVTIQRTFLVDSQSVSLTLEQVRRVSPDFLEVMPGIAPEGIRMLAGQAGCPVIAGGLIRTVAQIRAALAAGAVAISTSDQALWRPHLWR